MQRGALFQVLEMRRAAHFGQNGEGVRVPFHQDLPHRYRLALGYLQARAVDHGIPLPLPFFLIHNHQRTVAVHHHQIALLVADGDQAQELHESVVFGLLRGLLRDAGGCAADVEGAHGQLRAGFSDGLGGNHTHGLAQLHQVTRREVAPVAHDADAPARLAGQHGANLDALDAGQLNRVGQLLGDLLVDVHNDVAFIVPDLFERHAAHDAVAERLNDFAALDDGADVNAVPSAAVQLADDDVLRHIHKAAREVAGVGGFQGGVGQALARAVRGDEVLQHGQALAEVGRD